MKYSPCKQCQSYLFQASKSLVATLNSLYVYNVGCTSSFANSTRTSLFQVTSRDHGILMNAYCLDHILNYRFKCYQIIGSDFIVQIYASYIASKFGWRWHKSNKIWTSNHEWHMVFKFKKYYIITSFNHYLVCSIFGA